MAVRYKFVHFNNRSDFDSYVPNPESNSANGNEFYNYVVFIKDTREIYTHGKFYNCNEYNDTDIKTLIQSINENLTEKTTSLQNEVDITKESLSSLDTIVSNNSTNVESLVSEVTENEYVTAKSLTDLYEGKINTPVESHNKSYVLGLDSIVNTSSTYDPNIYTDSGIIYANNLSTTSDNRLKDFVYDIDIDFENLKQIPKKYYYWKDKSMGEDLQIGTSAQELVKVYPECVNYDEESDRYSVNYQKLSIVALAAIDKLHDRVSELESKLYDKNN